jgi:hypothetical protein
MFVMRLGAIPHLKRCRQASPCAMRESAMAIPSTSPDPPPRTPAYSGARSSAPGRSSAIQTQMPTM